MTRAWVSCAILSAVVACSGAAATNDPGVEPGAGSDAGGSQGAGAGAGSGGSGLQNGGDVSSGSDTGAAVGPTADAQSASTTGDAGGAVASLYDAPPPVDADVAETVTLTADPFTVDPGGEVYKCQTFANPFGRDVDLVYRDGTMSAGSHHFFLFNMDPTTLRTDPTPLGDCPGAGLEFHPFPYLSQQPHWIVNYPQSNMGYPLAAANALMINVHFLNSSSSALQPTVRISITAAKPGVVTTHVGTIFLNNTVFSVPANTPKTQPVDESKTWTPFPGQLPDTYNIFTSWSHMHRTALDFRASANGSVFYEETNWDSPQLFLHNPPLPMTGSTPISWTCTYYNDTDSDLSFGDSAISNVMCIYLGQYYPVADPQNPDIISVLN